MTWSKRPAPKVKKPKEAQRPGHHLVRGGKRTGHHLKREGGK
jgi:hypothetical protein